MDSFGRCPRWLLAAPLLAAFAEVPAVAQAPDAYPATASTSTIEIYYGTRPVVRAGPQPFAPPQRVMVPQMPPLVVPAIAQTQTPIADTTQPTVRTTEAMVGVLDAFRSGTRSVSSAATQVLERVGDRLLANNPHREIVSPAPVLMPVLPPTLPVDAMALLPSPAPLPAMKDVTPLTVPVPARAEPYATQVVSTVAVDSLMTTDRLVSALGIAVGVAGGLGFTLMLVLFLRRPAGAAVGTRGLPMPVLSGSGPLIVSERGLPKVPHAVSQSRPDSEPEQFDPSQIQIQIQDGSRRTVEQRRPRTEDAVVQFILDQNLAVLSAIGPSRPHDSGYPGDITAPVRIA